MKIITKYGNSFDVDDSLAYKDEYVPYIDTAVVVQDDLRLEKQWVVYICERKFGSRPGDVPDVIAEYKFDHEPTEEEIMYAYVHSGVGPFSGYASVEQVWVFGSEV